MSRLLGFIVVLLFGFFICTTPTHASAGLPSPQEQETNSPVAPKTSPLDAFQPQVDSSVQPNLGVLTQGILIETLAALSCQIAGIDPLDPYGRCIAVDPQTRKLTRADQAGGGAIAFVTKGISGTYQIPVSSSQYISDLRSNFGITKSAYAQRQEQSLGFKSLSPILEIWKGFRNLVFLFFVLIFSALGIGIMFRLHVDARAVMTVQNQIPKLVIGLVLISFSYAIAGLMIDFMYVLIYLFFNVAAKLYESMGMDPVNVPSLSTNTFGFVNGLYSPEYNNKFYDGINAASKISPVAGMIKSVMNSGIMSVSLGASMSVGEIVGSLFEGVLDSTIGSLFGMMMSPLSIAVGPVGAMCAIQSHLPNLAEIPGLGVINKIPLVGSLPFVGGGGPECNITDVIQNLPKLIIQSITSLIAFLVVLVAILFSMFRLWFTLIKAYLFLLMDIVFAPFWIATGLLPKGGLGFWAWFRSVMANLAVFPVTIGVLLLGKLFMDSFGSGNGEHFVPPLIGNPDDPNEIGMLIGLGMILLTPQLIDQVKGILKTKSPNFPAIGAAVGVGRGVAGKPFKEIKHEFFGKDAFNNPRMGTQFIGSRLGRWAGALTGGSFEKEKYDNLKGVKTSTRIASVFKPWKKDLPKGAKSREEADMEEQIKKEERLNQMKAARNPHPPTPPAGGGGVPPLDEDDGDDEPPDGAPPTGTGGGPTGGGAPSGGGAGGGTPTPPIPHSPSPGGTTALAGDTPDTTSTLGDSISDAIASVSEEPEIDIDPSKPGGMSSRKKAGLLAAATPIVGPAPLMAYGAYKGAQKIAGAFGGRGKTEDEDKKESPPRAA